MSNINQFIKSIILLISLSFLISCGNGSSSINSNSISPPTNLSAVAGDTQVSLSWDSTNTTTYNLYYATASFANLNDISNYSALRGATLVANLGTNTYTTTSLTNGSKYYFVITAVQNSIESKGSNEVHATPQVVIINTSTTTLLNDMGITWGGGYTSGNNTTCTSNISAPQDCHQGRDAGLNLGNSTFTFVNGSGTTKIAKVGAGVAGFDFTRLNANGSTHTGSVYATSPWSCVRDNHTGLVWEVKTDKGSKSTTTNIHHKDNEYKWGGLTALGRTSTSTSTVKGDYHDNWNSLVTGSNNESLCGFSTGWRVPTREELRSIVHYGVTHPAIDTNYFPHTPDNHFWSASPHVNDVSDAWEVNFEYGFDGYYFRNHSYGVRLVHFGE